MEREEYNEMLTTLTRIEAHQVAMIADLDAMVARMEARLVQDRGEDGLTERA